MRVAKVGKTRAQWWVSMDPGRARSNIRKQCRCLGKRASAYTSTAYKAAKALIASSVRRQCADRQQALPLVALGPVRVTIWASPPRTHRTGPAQGLPLLDADAVIKCVLDALIGVAYEDDSQVLEVQAGKEPKGDETGIRIWVEEITT
jgi:Holliday junction resolvase RusA-like endonuclease